MDQSILNQALQYRIDGKSFAEIHALLLQEGLDEPTVSDIIYHTQKAYHSKIRTIGFIAAGIGIAILLTGFFILLSMEFDHPYFKYILYGLNTVGATLVFYGMVKILGW